MLPSGSLEHPALLVGFGHPVGSFPPWFCLPHLLGMKDQLWKRGRAEVLTISLLNWQRARGLIEFNDLRISPLLRRC